jgi:hypothetical protein
MKKHRALKAKNPASMVAPEERLTPLLVFSIVWAASFFLFVAGAYSKVNIAVPIIAIVFLGMGVLYIFLAGFNYILDVYLWCVACCYSWCLSPSRIDFFFRRSDFSPRRIS